MKRDFQEGDKVHLKRGGPAMTVEWIEEQTATCAWFERERVEQHAYLLADLERWPPARTAEAAPTP
jgi:uncharacterized protein YodC (DUF2158 family)